MYLFFDTETTGLPKNWKAPISDLNNWPRLVQIAWLYYDEKGQFIEGADYIIKPDGFNIPRDAAAVHGISTERALEEGRELSHVLYDFNELLADSQFLVAHNISFDEKVTGAEFLRAFNYNPVGEIKKLCTMESSTDFCGISGKYGYKWPKLSELHVKLFGEDFEEAHNAAADINATAKCFWELKRMGLL